MDWTIEELEERWSELLERYDAPDKIPDKGVDKRVKRALEILEEDGLTLLLAGERERAAQYARYYARVARFAVDG